MKKLKVEIDNQKISVYFKKPLSNDFKLKHEFPREEISNISFFNRMMSGIKDSINTILIFSIKKENEKEQQFIITPDYAEEILRELKNYKYSIANEEEIFKTINDAKKIKNNETFYSKMTLILILSIIFLGILIPLLIFYK